MNEQMYQIAFSQLKGVDYGSAQKILQVSSLSAFFSCSKMDLVQIYGINPINATKLYQQFSLDIKNAQQTYELCIKNGIIPIFFTHKNYPQRLLECYDAPLLLYVKGNKDLNKGKFISIVGTRNATHYGKQLCHDLVGQLSHLLTDVTIVSGLAYGIDIAAHKAALEANVPTIGVLAGGLHRIYPAAHHCTALKMIQEGALITEQSYYTASEKRYFLQRNRIIAGISDAVVVVESAAKGGALVTASIAGTYNKDVFVFPGRTNDMASAGCNALIKHHKATMIENANDLCYFMGWSKQKKRNDFDKTKHNELIETLSKEEQIIIRCIKEVENISIDQLSYLTHLKVEDLMALLLALEFQNIVVCLPGNRYQLR